MYEGRRGWNTGLGHEVELRRELLCMMDKFEQNHAKHDFFLLQIYQNTSDFLKIKVVSLWREKTPHAQKIVGKWQRRNWEWTALTTRDTLWKLLEQCKSEYSAENFINTFQAKENCCKYCDASISKKGHFISLRYNDRESHFISQHLYKRKPCYFFIKLHQTAI